MEKLLEGATTRTPEHLSANIAIRSDRGRVRRSNEDSFAADETAGLFVVCDGMGGAAGGEVASVLAAQVFVQKTRAALLTQVSTRKAMECGVCEANAAVYGRASLQQQLRGMGSTLVALHVRGRQATVANVGDSRAYVLSGGGLTQLTQDHSYVGEAVRSGRMTTTEARRSSMQSVITRAVGTDPKVEADFFEVALAEGDVVLLATDGLTRHVAEADLERILSSGAEVSAMCEELVALANARGGTDNITCILVRVRDGEGR